MAPLEEMHVAMVNRSIRAIKAELEFLTDASIITPQTLSSILSQIPPQTALHAPISVGAVPTASPLPGAPQPPVGTSLPIHENRQPQQQQQQQQQQQPQQQPQNEQQPNSYYEKADHPSSAPPAYGAPPPTLPPLCTATALYVYAGEDAGDLSLQPNDQIAVTEYMNAEWWKGRSLRTGQEGIFPRSYVRVEEKAMPQGPPSQQQQPYMQQQPNPGNNYGNAPLETSGMGNGTGHVPGKGEEMGKKFGKKLGNAAIFGAGASIGANIVNGIF